MHNLKPMINAWVALLKLGSLLAGLKKYCASTTAESRAKDLASKNVLNTLPLSEAAADVRSWAFLCCH